MDKCQKCKAIVNPKWTNCMACGCPIKNPDNDADGGQGVPCIDVEYPISVKMKSAILGRDVKVNLWPDRATVDGTEYSLSELDDLIRRKLSHEDLRTVHCVKQDFEGAVIP